MTTAVRRGQWQTASDVLAQVSRRPGITRAAVARELRLSTGSATEVTARLRDVQLLTEVPAPSQGRGRPTTVLRAHPQGPVVLALDLRQGSWRSAVVALDGSFLEQQSKRHRSRRPQVVLGNLQREVEQAREQYGERLRVVSLAAPGTIRDNHLMQAPTLDWAELDLETVTAGTGLPLLAGNDATLSGVAEARTGAAAGAGTALHLIVEVGIGGTLLIDGVPAQGASGAGGEYGHIPFGERGRGVSVRCPWLLGPGDRRTRAGHGTSRSRRRTTRMATPRPCCGVPTALRAVRSPRWSLRSPPASPASSTPHDPDVVTLGGLAIPLRAAAEATFEQAYLAGLMTFHRASPPPVLAATHQPDGPLRGAAALALDHLTSEPAIAAWAAQH